MEISVIDRPKAAGVSNDNLLLANIDVQQALEQMLNSNPEFARHLPNIHIRAPLHCVLANEAAVMGCLANLVRNALNCGGRGGRPEVAVWAEVIDRAWVRVWVEDRGPGIPPDVLPEVYDTTFIGNETHRRRGASFAVVRKLIARMGGRVGVESQLGEGSSFWFELRRA